MVSWVNHVEELMSSNKLSWKAICNADETRLNISGDQHKAKFIVTNAKKTNGVTSKTSAAGSLARSTDPPESAPCPGHR